MTHADTFGYPLSEGDIVVVLDPKREITGGAALLAARVTGFTPQKIKVEYLTRNNSKMYFPEKVVFAPQYLQDIYQKD